MSFQKLYKRKSLPDAAFLLEKGDLFFYINNTDKYTIRGKKLIIGATELIMHHVLKKDADREETVIATASSELKRIPLEKFMAGIETFQFVLNVSAVMAKQVVLTNEIIKNLLEELGGEEQSLKEFSVKYFLLVERLKEEYAKRKYPWLVPLIKSGEENLTYTSGEAYHKSSVSIKFIHAIDISEGMVEYEAGSTIYEEGSAGSDMYILRRGSIDVFVDKNKIAVIEEEGTIIGEMSILLGGKRTATLIAKNDIVVSRITKEDLKIISSKNLSLMRNIMESLAKRHYYNILKIENINEKIALKSARGGDDGQTLLKIRHAEDAAGKLVEKIEKLYMERKHDFLKEIIKNF